MKYLVVKPNVDSKVGKLDKVFEEFEVKKVNDIQVFIEQNVGKQPVKRIVGDYVVWISDPYTIRNTEGGKEKVLDNITLTPNLMIHESEIAYGSVVFTANNRVGSNEYEGLTDIDIGYIMNSFTLSGSILVETSENTPVAIDRLNDNILNPSGVLSNNSNTITPNILTVEDSVENTETTIPTDDIYIL